MKGDSMLRELDDSIMKIKIAGFSGLGFHIKTHILIVLV